MEYKVIDAESLKETLAGIEYISDTDNDKRKPFGITGPDYDGLVIANVVRNGSLDSGVYVSIVKGEDYDNATLYGFGIDTCTTVSPATLALWAMGLHLNLEGGAVEDYQYLVFTVTPYIHRGGQRDEVMVYVNDIPYMSMYRGRSGTYFTVAVAAEFHQSIHHITPRMGTIWTAQVTERWRYNAIPELPQPMLTGFSKIAVVLDTLTSK